MSKRHFDRRIKRLETTFISGTEIQKGMSSDISEGGIFIRTRHAYIPGTALDIEIILPDGRISKLKGVVRRSMKTQISTLKNGMGVEITEKDSNFIDFIGQLNR